MAASVEFVIDSGSPLALALTAARAARERKDLSAMDAEYRRAVRLAHELSARQPGLRAWIAVEHVSSLRVLADSDRAAACCVEYLAEYGEETRLLLMRAETTLTRGDHGQIEADIAAIHRLIGGRPEAPTDDALLYRLEGLAAARRSQLPLALRHLRRSRAGYAALGDSSAVATLDDDIRLVAARQDTATAERSPRPRGGSPNSRLTRSEELRMVGRYEEALTELVPALSGGLDPALRFFFIQAQVRLLRLLRADDEADELMPALYEAARATALPEENLNAAQRLELTGAPDSPGMDDDDSLWRARSLTRAGRLAEAEQLLLELAENSPGEPDDRRTAVWHLAMAELLTSIARHAANQGVGSPAVARQAIAHGRECVRLATPDSMVAIRIPGLRVLGHAYAELDSPDHLDRAVTAWSGAHRAEESVAALQPTDHLRLRMLHAVPTEFDERIQWARRRADGLGGPKADAIITVAMEAARGATILPHILPGRRPLVRELPDPDDVTGAYRWIRRAIRGLPHSQIIWMLHATQDEVHHAFVERTLLGPHIHHVAVSCKRHTLIQAIDALTDCWKSNGASHPMKIESDPATFDEQLRTLEDLLGLRNLPELPEHVTRIAVVAGGELSEIPFALLPCPGTSSRLIGRHYALSDLPCLSVRRPLHQRSRQQRGTHPRRMLLVHGPPNDSGHAITPAREVRMRTVLGAEYSTPGPPATPPALRATLQAGQYRQVRIDSHGTFGGDSSQSALLLAPRGTEGWLSPDGFQAMNLSATGTLILGGCETGMFTRIGRDERTGFVRAALTSGASAVLAARWKALDDVAAGILDEFEQNLRRCPRDVALYRAQRNADAPDCHPARWAVWTLYGSAGYQTRRGPLLRWLDGVIVKVRQRISAIRRSPSVNADHVQTS